LDKIVAMPGSIDRTLQRTVVDTEMEMLIINTFKKVFSLLTAY